MDDYVLSERYFWMNVTVRYSHNAFYLIITIRVRSENLGLRNVHFNFEFDRHCG